MGLSAWHPKIPNIKYAKFPKDKAEKHYLWTILVKCLRECYLKDSFLSNMIVLVEYRLKKEDMADLGGISKSG